MTLMGIPLATAAAAWSKSTLPTSMLLRCRPAMTALSSLSVWTSAPAACRPNWSETSLGSRADAYATLMPLVDGADDPDPPEADAELDELESEPPHALSPSAAAAMTTTATVFLIGDSLGL